MTLAAQDRRLRLALPALLLLAGALTAPACALDLIQDVSREKARELGITVEVKPRSDDVWVQVHYRPAEPKKPFRRTVLEVTRDGKRLLLTSLVPLKPAPDTMRFDFYIDPAALPNATVTLIVQEEPLTGIGYRLKMKDFQPPATAR